MRVVARVMTKRMTRTLMMELVERRRMSRKDLTTRMEREKARRRVQPCIRSRTRTRPSNQTISMISNHQQLIRMIETRTCKNNQLQLHPTSKT